MKSNTFHVKLLWLLFGQILEKIGLLFNLASGHSAWKVHEKGLRLWNWVMKFGERLRCALYLIKYANILALFKNGWSIVVVKWSACSPSTDDCSLNPAEGSSFSVKFVFEKLFKKGHSVPPFSFLFSIFSLNKNCHEQDSNRRSSVTEVTNLSTVPLVC